MAKKTPPIPAPPRPKYLVRIENGSPVFSHQIGEAVRWSQQPIAEERAVQTGGHIEKYLGDWIVCVPPPEVPSA